MKPLGQSTLIVCSIVRNAQHGLKKNIPVIDALCRLCKDYRIVVYENDSIDNTKSLLLKWKHKDSHRIHILLNQFNVPNTIPSQQEVKGNPFFSRKRIDKMSSLRNQYMEYIDRQKWDADYLLVVDLDVAHLYLENILTSFNLNMEWDAVTAFGYSTSPRFKRRYHDTYALTEYGDTMSPQTEIKIKNLADKFAGLRKKDKCIRVFSAFGGLAIYRYEAVKGLRYYPCENNDKRVEVRCEHYSICSQMAERGYNRIYINPAMSLKYQNVTCKIIWSSFIRRIHLLIKQISGIIK